MAGGTFPVIINLLRGILVVEQRVRSWDGPT